jgi:hypothetical protein
VLSGLLDTGCEAKRCDASEATDGAGQAALFRLEGCLRMTEEDQAFVDWWIARRGRPLKPHEIHLALAQAGELGVIDCERLPYSVLQPLRRLRKT